MTTKKSDGVEYGAFRKDGQTVVALTVDDAVRYQFDGWEQVQPPAPENQPPEPDTQS